MESYTNTVTQCIFPSCFSCSLKSGTTMRHSAAIKQIQHFSWERIFSWMVNKSSRRNYMLLTHGGPILEGGAMKMHCTNAATTCGNDFSLGVAMMLWGVCSHQVGTPMKLSQATTPILFSWAWFSFDSLLYYVSMPGARWLCHLEGITLNPCHTELIFGNMKDICEV